MDVPIRAVQHPDVAAAWWFGSGAAGAPFPRDVDIALVFRDGVENSRRWNAMDIVASQVEEATGLPADVLDLEGVDPIVQLRIVSTGRLLHAADKRRSVRVHERILSEAGDFAAFWTPHRDAWLATAAHARR
jgi:hypothetical protein